MDELEDNPLGQIWTYFLTNVLLSIIRLGVLIITIYTLVTVIPFLFSLSSPQPVDPDLPPPPGPDWLKPLLLVVLTIGLWVGKYFAERIIEHDRKAERAAFKELPGLKEYLTRLEKERKNLQFELTKSQDQYKTSLVIIKHEEEKAYNVEDKYRQEMRILEKLNREFEQVKTRLAQETHYRKRLEAQLTRAGLEPVLPLEDEELKPTATLKGDGSTRLEGEL